MPWNWLFLAALFPLCLLYFLKCIRYSFASSLLALFSRTPPISREHYEWLVYALISFGLMSNVLYRPWNWQFLMALGKINLYTWYLILGCHLFPALFPQASILFLLSLPWVCKNKAAAASCDARPLHGGRKRKKGKKMISLSKGGGSPFDYDNSTWTLNQS